MYYKVRLIYLYDYDTLTNAYTVNKTIVTFIERLREHPGCASAVMLPIIEVNGTFFFILIQRLALALTIHQRE